MLKVHLAAYEPMRPHRIDRKGPPEQRDTPVSIGAAQIDYLPARMDLQVQRPVVRKGTSRGAVFHPLRQALALGDENLLRSALDHRQIGMVETLPDFGLPETIEVFDHGLEAVFPWGDKNRCDPQAQTDTHDATQHIGMVVTALKTRIVVELDEVRQPLLTPIGQHVSSTV